MLAKKFLATNTSAPGPGLGGVFQQYAKNFGSLSQRVVRLNPADNPDQQQNKDQDS